MEQLEEKTLNIIRISNDDIIKSQQIDATQRNESTSIDHNNMMEYQAVNIQANNETVQVFIGDDGCIPVGDDDSGIPEQPAPSYESVMGNLPSLPSTSQLPKYQDVVASDPPPTYHSMFNDPIGNVFRTLGPLAEIGYNSTVRNENTHQDINDTVRTGASMYLRHGCKFFIVCMIMLLVSAILSFILPLIMIIIGIAYINQCPVQPRIPIYLIVLGFFQMIEFCGRFAFRYFKHNNSSSVNSCQDRYQRKDPLGYFLVVWFVIGSMWVYQTTPKCENCSNIITSSMTSANATNTIDLTTVSQSSSYCHDTLYTFAFWTVTTYYSLVAFFTMYVLADLFIRAIGRCCTQH